jgi:hypothetical protein
MGRILALVLTPTVIFLSASIAAVGIGQAQDAPRTVWNGVFTSDQADRGRRLFAADCAECHGADLEGGSSKPLRGDQFWKDWTEATVGELLSYVQANMPFSEDGSKKGTLAASAYVDIVTHILAANGFPPGPRELTADSSAGVQIVPKNGPGELPDSTHVRVVGCLASRGADGSWRIVNAARPRRAAASPSPADREGPQGDRSFELKFVLTSLAKYVGHRVAVTGSLIGAGGANGINVTGVESVSAGCT